MRGSLFLVCLFALLLKGLDSSGTPSGKPSYTSANFLEQIQQVSSFDSNDNYSFVRDAQIQWEEQLLVDDYEDEKNNRSLALKQPLLIRREFTLPEPFHLDFQFGCAKEYLTYFGHLPEIYIIQRSLRI